ncbi:MULTISPECIES: SAM-dependent methyltransferase [Streptomyces]|uniref:SAM-dependent methyltransferase n=1 Tax=Streptomyces TaxID=1883 RepID=UPI00052AE702|nr:SAM-dependent methyltransferase [Streptomyces sp. CCM_MD2014]AIV39035.1 translation initiation factor IF-2 [Streptomyces sp. CCM_MD2014]MDA4889760.1 SAM-dependent methyltransferase [Streptomyces sp. MS2A]
MPESPAVNDARGRIRTDQPHTARIWNYWLGGKDNYPVDQQAGDRIRQLHPGIGDYALADRRFLGRAVRRLVGEYGIRQFLDIGTGLPSADNTHEVAQRIAPESRIVYVDNDPIVLAHAEALLTSTPEGRTDYLDEDLRNVDTILEHAARTLDFGEPVALMLLGVVIFVEEDDEAYGLVRRLVDALPAGSHLVLSHTVTRPDMPDVDAAVAFWNEHGTPKLTQRTPEAVTRFFDGLELLPPGVVSCNRWHAESGDGELPAEVAMFGGVGRKA